MTGVSPFKVLRSRAATSSLSPVALGRFLSREVWDGRYPGTLLNVATRVFVGPQRQTRPTARDLGRSEGCPQEICPLSRCPFKAGIPATLVSRTFRGYDMVSTRGRMFGMSLIKHLGAEYAGSLSAAALAPPGLPHTHRQNTYSTPAISGSAPSASVNLPRVWAYGAV